MSSILEGADKAYLKEYNESEDERRLDALQDSLGSVRQITKGGKYLGQDVIDIMIQIQTFAEKLGIDPKELDYAENQVREAQNNLESAIYGLEEPFTDMISTLQNRIDDARMDAEDDLEEGQRCWKGYKKKGTKPGTGKNKGKQVNNCVKATESEEVDEGMYDQDAFDAIFKNNKDKGSMEKPKSKPKDTGMYNQPTSKPNKDKKLNEFQRGSFDDDKPKRPSKGRLVTKDGMPVTLPLRTQDFRGDEIVIVDYIPPHKPSSTGRIVTDDGMTYFPSVADLKIIGHQFDVDEGLAGAASGAYLGSKIAGLPGAVAGGVLGHQATKEGLAGAASGAYLGSKIAGLPGAVAGGVLGHQATKEGRKSSIGKVMEMYDDYMFLIYINGKLAADTPIQKNQKNKFERVIKHAIPDAEVIFKPTPAHYYTDEELAEGSGKIRAGIAGILLLGGLLGLNNHEAQKVYDKSHQLQQLTQVYMVAKERGDEAKMKDVRRRIGNHKMRLDLGKGDVDFDGLPGKDDIKDIDYINVPGEK